MLHIVAIYHVVVDMLHIVAICHIAVDMLHIVAICHITVDMSNRSKICPYKMKKCFRQTAPHKRLQKMLRFFLIL